MVTVEIWVIKKRCVKAPSGGVFMLLVMAPGDCYWGVVTDDYGMNFGVGNI